MNEEFWNSRYAAETYVYGTAPNDFLLTQAQRLTSNAAVLCLAEGEGRNATYLAAQGLRVTGVDQSRRGLEKAQRLARERNLEIETIVADLSTYDPGVLRWDAVVSIFAHLPPHVRVPLRQRLRVAMRPGGVFILEHYHPNQLEYRTGGPADVALLTTVDELEADFAGWEVLHRFEGERTVREGAFHDGLAYVTQFVAQKPLDGD